MEDGDEAQSTSEAVDERSSARRVSTRLGQRKPAALSQQVLSIVSKRCTLHACLQSERAIQVAGASASSGAPSPPLQLLILSTGQ